LKGRSVVSLRPFGFAPRNFIRQPEAGGVICGQITTACRNTRFIAQNE
jgi:hypothetical protein